MTDVTPGHETCHHGIYKLSCPQFELLLARAQGRCEICSKPAAEEYDGKLVIDHEGRISWSAVRGLLCRRCNAHMRRVDAGSRPISRQTFDYMDRSGLFVPQNFRGWGRWKGSCEAARAEILASLIASSGAGRGALRAKPRLACAPRAVIAPW